MAPMEPSENMDVEEPRGKVPLSTANSTNEDSESELGSVFTEQRRLRTPQRGPGGGHVLSAEGGGRSVAPNIVTGGVLRVRTRWHGEQMEYSVTGGY